MYKVIVVDDETWICKLIRKIVDWEAAGFRIIADVQEAQDALKLIEQEKPDLVVTDIRMPGLDGISLIKEVRNKGIDTEFVIISGYSDFEYAQSAVSHNVLGYLLKPISKDDLYEILEKAKKQIRNKQLMMNKIEASDTYMLEHDLWKVIDRTDANVLVETFNERYNTQFADGKFRIAIFKKDSDLKNESKNTNANQFFSFLVDIKDTYKDLFFEFVVISNDSRNSAVAVLNYDEKSLVEIESMFSRIIKSYHSSSDMRNSKLTIGLGCETVSIGDIGYSYDSAKDAVKARVSLGTGRVIDATKEAGLQPVKIIIDARREKKLATLFDILDMDGAADEISKILENTEKEYANSHLAYNYAASKIIDILFSVMQRKDFELKGELSLKKVMQRIDDCSTRAQIKSVIYQIIKDFRCEYAKEKQNNGSLIIKEIKSFVAENYMRDIGLDDVAKLVCLNPTYVSEIFKKCNEGENFSEYLIGYRIGIAKELLKDVRYKIIDVSSMVGYKDAKYFSRLFKEKVGVNPTNYRKLSV